MTPGPTTSRAPVWALSAGAAIAATAASLAFFFPRIWLWPALHAPDQHLLEQPELHRAFFVLAQARHPWAPVENFSEKVLEWRLFFPALAHYSGLPDFLLLSLPMAGCILALSMVARWIHQATANLAAVLAGTLLCATSSWFFVSTGWLGYFDSWLILCLLLAATTTSPVLLASLGLAAPWIDERFVLALPVCLAVRAVLQPPVGSGSSTPLLRDMCLLALGISPYLLIRAGAELSHLRPTGQSYLQILYPEGAWRMTTLPSLLAGLWQGLRFGWLPFVAFLGIAATTRNWRLWWVLPAVALSLAVNLTIAADISRSASVAVPAMLAGVILAVRLRPRIAVPVILLCAAANLLFPARHVVSKFTLSIESAWVEMDRWRNPPEFASASHFHSLALEAVRAHRLDEAIRLESVAAALEPDDQEVRTSLAALMLAEGSPSQGFALLDQVLQENPSHWQARLTRARFRLRYSNTAGARLDLDYLMQAAPPDCPERADAEILAKSLPQAP